ncbi:hypothetical protein [Alteromonas lipolytica]|uniref:PEP-CTERM protein-sorting domain-containing protein n=1 Tax=Alteromonas lipolytica TaxID=1856405 RepID=A0A1E8FDW4_9ALTE|nr:hypothetical protein [Alteromonas lipolytica]OFI33778.1 hypothetical protein BFC17_19600 [Alteromonas lipolytica]GGF68462.1 hypothetical protein GCM10011338_20830 [Alteromonas lipolytica]
MLKKAIFLSAALFAGSSNATLLTDTSGLGFDVTTVGASTIGGVVVDLLGTNGTHIISQLAASNLFVGFYDTGSPAPYQGNPGTVGIQTGFDAAVTAALGGGLAGASFRFTLWDGDTATGDFDEDDNLLLINGLSFGSWSDVNAEWTNGAGAVLGAQSGGGFRDDTLDTGWFTSTDTALLDELLTSLESTEEMVFQLMDDDPYDNFFDFTQGIDQELIDVGQGPTVQPSEVSAPAALSLMGLGLLGMAGFRRKKA